VDKLQQLDPAFVCAAGQAEAAIVKADWPSVSTGFILDRSLAAIYSRGKHVAGLD
jgi:hypothetical protein